MNVLILIAHGSRLPAANDEVRRLADQLRDHLDGGFAAVSCAFLEIADPSIPAAIDAAISAGAARISLVPYFLTTGRHVALDIPAIAEAKRREHPGVAITLQSYLGASPLILEALAEIALTPVTA